MLKQVEQAEFEVPRTANIVTGNVSVGRETYSSTSVLATPLLKRVRQEYPHVNLFINDNFGLVLSEMVMSGGMDMAMIYGTPSTKGVKVQPLLLEALFLIAPSDAAMPAGGDAAVAVAALGDTELLLPGRTHFLRQLIDKAFEQAGVQPRGHGGNRIGRDTARSHRGGTGSHNPALGRGQHLRRLARAGGPACRRAHDTGNRIAVRAGPEPDVGFGAGRGRHPGAAGA
jgi:DNA-binding transcriptional LysR family regulator